MQKSLFNDRSEVISDLKHQTMEVAREKGCICPVCDQFVKFYHRGIPASSARNLILAYKRFGVGEYFHITDISEISQTGGEFAKLRFWGLIQEKFHEQGDKGKKHSGCWKLTPKAVDFVSGSIQVQKYVILYNGGVFGVSSEQVTITDCLNEKFDYNELMKRS